MQAVNGYFLYVLGQIAGLFAMADGVAARVFDPVIERSINLLSDFRKNEQNIANLPDSVDRAFEIVTILQYVRGEYLRLPNTLMVERVRLTIAHSVNRFQTALEQELGRAHTYIIEEKRGYSPRILVDEIKKIIPRRVLPYLSLFTVTNLQDAGAALAFDHFTSCGFLTMRAVEDAARYYYEFISGVPASGVDSNGDRWFLTFGQIAWKLTHDVLPDLKTAHTPTGKLGLIVPVMSELNEIYRNPLAHPEIVKLDEDDAIDVFNKGIAVISDMVRDVMAGGAHFHQLYRDYNFTWTFALQL